MSTSREVPQAVIDALRRGDKMTAIKLVREVTGDDLKAALTLVQQVADQLKERPQSHSGPHEVPETKGQREVRERTESVLSKQHPPTVTAGDSGGRGLIAALLLIALAALIWWALGS